jgi:hypothetical protein
VEDIPVKRPSSVTVVAVLMIIGGVAYLLGGALSLFLWFQPGEVQLFFGSAVSDWYWIVNAALSVFLGLAFIWVARLAMAGDYGAGLTITMLAIINLIFSVFNIFQGYGWVTLFVAIVVLILNQGAAAQQWYRRGGNA